MPVHACVERQYGNVRRIYCIRDEKPIREWSAEEFDAAIEDRRGLLVIALVRGWNLIYPGATLVN